MKQIDSPEVVVHYKYEQLLLFTISRKQENKIGRIIPLGKTQKSKMEKTYQEIHNKKIINL